MANGYGYGNARVRAMRSRLLTAGDYDGLLATTTVEDFITRLAGTPYKEDVETALVRFEGVRCVFEAVRANLARTLLQVRSFYDGEPAVLIDILLRRWDRQNVLTILRAQVGAAARESALAATVPAGKIDATALRELARQSGLRATLDLMVTWRLPYAHAVNAVRGQGGASPELDQLELALNREHYASLLAAVAGGNGDRALVREWIEAEIDVANLDTVLRLARLPELVPLVRQRYHAADVRPLLIEPGGHLPAERLAEVAAGAGGVEGVVRALSHTRYAEALAAGLKRYQAGQGGITALERALERWLVEYGAAMFQRGPLTIAIVIGYLTCKQNEAANVRLIAEGVALSVRRELVRRQMVIV